MERDSLSTYDSIIPAEPWAQWHKLGNTDVLVQLHRMFWGKNMKDEEINWRATQPKDESMNVDVDESAEGDAEDEIGSGCYILNLGIPRLGSPVLWIRKEYIRLYDFCEAHLNSCSENQKTPLVIVTGQPGIGKSCWIRYALRRRLAERKPVMWYHDSLVFLFVEEGVYQSPPHLLSTNLKQVVWTLVDSEESPTGVPPHLAVDATNHFNIFSTSPHSIRWKPIQKTTNWAICIMNPWSKKEISKAAVIHGFKSCDKRIYEMYDEFGPTPRICFDLPGNEAQLAEHKDRYDDALQELSGETLRKMITEIKGFKMDVISHTILLLKRMPKKLGDSDGENWASKSVEPISHTVEAAFRDQLGKQTQAEQLQLYLYLANVEATRCIAGLVFESLVQSKLEKRIKLVLIPMVKREPGGSGQGKELPRWHSNHEDGVNPPSVKLIDMTPARTIVYSGSSLGQIEDEVYYIPESHNQVAFNSFVMANQELYIFRSALGSDHPVKEGIIPFFTQESLPPRVNWNFVYVVPTKPASEICCPRTQDSDLELLDKMDLFSAVLDPA